MGAGETSVRITTEPSLDGSCYVVSIAAGDDVAVVMDRDRALAYAYELLRAVASAEYDAAVMAQLAALSGETSAIGMVAGLRADRPPLDAAATAPFVFQPGVSRRDRRGFLTIRLDGEPLGQWALPDARAHALAVLEAHVVADLDAAYHRTLTGVIGVDGPVARAVVNGLAEHRPANGAEAP